MPERIANGGSDPVSRLVLEKRCELYSRVAHLVMDLEEALEQDDALRTRYQLLDLRRALRGALAFLTDEVYAELERLEALLDLLPAREGSLPPGTAPELSDRLALLHVKVARSLRQPYLQELEEVVGLPARLKRRLEEEALEREELARRRRTEEQCWRHEAEARALIADEQYDKAVKALRRAIRLDGERAVFHNDLGVVLSLLGRTEEAIDEYRLAVALNERRPQERTDEWTTSYYNLGVALRKAAHEAKERAAALRHLGEAQAAFEEFVRLGATGAKVHEARAALEQLAAQAQRLHAAEAAGA